MRPDSIPRWQADPGMGLPCLGLHPTSGAWSKSKRDCKGALSVGASSARFLPDEISETFTKFGRQEVAFAPPSNLGAEPVAPAVGTRPRCSAHRPPFTILRIVSSG
jgi:hypothetical protein